MVTEFILSKVVAKTVGQVRHVQAFEGDLQALGE
jgi:hypothetical protein